jgi:hypothetical protein
MTGSPAPQSPPLPLPRAAEAGSAPFRPGHRPAAAPSAPRPCVPPASSRPTAPAITPATGSPPAATMPSSPRPAAQRHNGGSRHITRRAPASRPGCGPASMAAASWRLQRPVGGSPSGTPRPGSRPPCPLTGLVTGERNHEELAGRGCAVTAVTAKYLNSQRLRLVSSEDGSRARAGACRQGHGHVGERHPGGSGGGYRLAGLLRCRPGDRDYGRKQ